LRYGQNMIKSFVDAEAALIWSGRRSRKLPSDIQPVALRKLRMLKQAQRLSDLPIPPANRLESLKGGRKGQYSIRINRGWRVCFRWTPGGPSHVEIVNYHDE
jgi:proteic killer suppression protein